MFAPNRIVAFIGPYIAIASGVIADWLLVHVHILALFHVAGSSLAGAIAQAAIFGVTAFVVWLGHQTWLKGYIAWAYGPTQGAVAAPPVVNSPTEPVRTQ